MQKVNTSHLFSISVYAIPQIKMKLPKSHKSFFKILPLNDCKLLKAILVNKYEKKIISPNLVNKSPQNVSVYQSTYLITTDQYPHTAVWSLVDFCTKCCRVLQANLCFVPCLCLVNSRVFNTINTVSVVCFGNSFTEQDSRQSNESFQPVTPIPLRSNHGQEDAYFLLLQIQCKFHVVF